MPIWYARAFAVFFGLLALQCAQAHAVDWKRYDNPRFGTVILVPSGFVAETPSVNGDGASFVSADGRARIAVYASRAPSVVTVDFDGYREWLAAEVGIAISYRAHGRGWFVISGRKGKDITYIKVVAGCTDRSVAHHVRISYPADEKQKYDPIVSRVARSLHHAGEAACHQE